MTEKQQTCEQRIDKELASTITSLKKLWAIHCNNGTPDEEMGSFEYYHLSFDYVTKDTWPEQKEGYFRYQLSWGGPADEFRIFVDAQLHVTRIEYWFLDWYDGSHRLLSGGNYRLIEDIYENYFKASGAVQKEMDKTLC